MDVTHVTRGQFLRDLEEQVSQAPPNSVFVLVVRSPGDPQAQVFPFIEAVVNEDLAVPVLIGVLDMGKQALADDLMLEAHGDDWDGDDDGDEDEEESGEDDLGRPH